MFNILLIKLLTSHITTNASKIRYDDKHLISDNLFLWKTWLDKSNNYTLLLPRWLKLNLTFLLRIQLLT